AVRSEVQLDLVFIKNILRGNTSFFIIVAARSLKFPYSPIPICLVHELLKEEPARTSLDAENIFFMMLKFITGKAVHTSHFLGLLKHFHVQSPTQNI
ncbi:hypothetical protein ACJX0J_035160, partial [Zea mays]